MTDISIIIPTYNRVGLMSRAIYSVLSQRYRNFEIIVVDDASTDGTQEYVQEKFKKEIDQGVIIYRRNEKNLERVRTRNRGVGYSQGSYIALLDDDDVWFPDHLESLHDFLKKNTHVGMAFSNWEYYESATKTIRVPMHGVSTGEGEYYKRLLLRAMIGYPSTSILRRDIIHRAGDFNDQLQLREDWEFFNRCAFYTDVGFISSVTARIYAHKGSYSGQKRKWVENTERAWTIISDTAKKLDIHIDPKIEAERELRLSRGLISIGRFEDARRYLFNALRHNKMSIMRSITIENIFKLMIGKKLYTWSRR